MSMPRLYFAPLEGITTYMYRNVHRELFGGCDAYYAPFISPSDNEKIGRKGYRDILPENNKNVNLKVQVLTNNATSFLKFSEKIKQDGYDEINLNLGCPSGTVVGKRRGAGFLRDKEALENFLEEVFLRCDIKISIKTRGGFESCDELDSLMEIYNKFPASLIIIHPRTRGEFYKGVPDKEAFKRAYSVSKNSLCYNGNIFSVNDYEKITCEFDKLNSVMIGRGAITNPAIFREIKGGKKLCTQELIAFSNKLAEVYNEKLDHNVFTLHKLKEIWLYMMDNFPEEKKIQKAVRKANKLSELLNAIENLPQKKNL